MWGRKANRMTNLKFCICHPILESERAKVNKCCD